MRILWSTFWALLFLFGPLVVFSSLAEAANGYAETNINNSITEFELLVNKVKSNNEKNPSNPNTAKLIKRAHLTGTLLARSIKEAERDKDISRLKATSYWERIIELQARIGLQVVSVRNTNKGLVSENIIVTERVAPTLPSDLRLTHRKNMWQKTKEAAMGGAKHFGVQYSYFLVAMGLLTVSELGLDYSNNPLAFDHYIQGSTSGLAALSFAAFMATNYPVVKHLQAARYKALPRWAPAYIGMAAGILAASVFYEFASDAHVQGCISSFKNGDFQNKAACEFAYDSWVSTSRIMKYAPVVVSVLSAAGLSIAARSVINKGAAATARTFPYLAMRAGKMVWLSTPYGRAADAIFNFALFLGIEQMISPYINAAWNTMNLHHLGFIEHGKLTEIHEDASILHTLSEETAIWPVVNKVMHAWPEECNEWKYEANKNTLPCLLITDTEKTLMRAFELRQLWRTKQIEGFLQSYNSWVGFAADHLALIGPTYEIYWQVMRQVNENDKNQAFKPIQLEIDATALIAENFKAPSKLTKYGVPLNTPYQAVLFAMACGADAGSINSVLRTPVGFMSEFVPPKITIGNNSICHWPAQLNRLFRYRENPFTKDNPNWLTSGPWKENYQKEYPDLLTYIFENLDPTVYRSNSKFSNFPIWWKKNIKAPYEEKWNKYRASYRKMVDDKLVPYLFAEKDNLWLQIRKDIFHRLDALAALNPKHDFQPAQEELYYLTKVWNQAKDNPAQIEVFNEQIFALNKKIFQWQLDINKYVSKDDWRYKTNQVLTSQVLALILEARNYLRYTKAFAEDSQTDGRLEEQHLDSKSPFLRR